MGKKAICLVLILAVFAFGCVIDGDGSAIGKGSGKQGMEDQKTAEERLTEGDYTDTETDYMVPNDYRSIESSIDFLLNAGNMIGDRHYDELEASVNKLERQGEDVSKLREKLARLQVAPRGSQKGNALSPDGNEKSVDNNKGTLIGQTPETSNDAKQEMRIGLLSPRGCEGNGSFLLGASPIALDDLQKILPMGMMSSVHITPTDHQYWHTAGYFGPSEDKSNPDRYRIYAPADGYIVELGIVQGFGDYRIIIEHSCNFYTIFIHVDKLSEKVLSSIKPEDGDPNTQVWPRIPVKEGEVIGSVGIGKFDFSVIDEGVTLKGFEVPKSYGGEVWKIHTVDTFDYYKEPLRSMLLKKSVKSTEPMGGRIDYDIRGKLIGSWFKENTNGYRGLGNTNYWTSHLSIVYDILDPRHIVVSIGDFEGEGRQYGVKGNAPNPEEVGTKNGLVKYELVPYDYYSGGKKWDGIEFTGDPEARNTDEVRGVALFQLTGDGKLKAEFFPSKKGPQVSGFTANAQVYER